MRRRVIVADTFGLVQYMAILDPGEYLDLPAWAGDRVRDGSWTITTLRMTDPPPEVMAGWQAPNWQEIADTLAAVLTEVAFEDSELQAAAEQAMDAYRVAVMAHDEALTVLRDDPPADAAPGAG